MLGKQRPHSSPDRAQVCSEMKIAIFNKVLTCVYFIKVLEDWAMPASYDLGLETERATLERLETQLVQQEQVTFIVH